MIGGPTLGGLERAAGATAGLSSRDEAMPAKRAELENEIRVVDRFPLIVVEFRGFPDDAQFAGYLEALDAITARQRRQGGLESQRIALLYDTTESTRPVTASQRRMQANYMKRARSEADPALEQRLGVCVVITNGLVRGVLTAVLWLAPMRERLRVCATRDEAELWCRRWVIGRVSEVPAPPDAAGEG
jgi:hypothetical protein